MLRRELMVRLPKAIGPAGSEKVVSGATDVPLSGTEVGDPAALWVMERLADEVTPAVAPVRNVTLMVQVPSGATVVQPFATVNDAALTPPSVALATVRFAVPVLVTVMGRVAEVETAWGQLTATRKLVERMEKSLLERAQKARDLIKFQYEHGAASLLDLLNAQRTYTATRGEYAQDLANYWTALSLLEQATAEELK